MTIYKKCVMNHNIGNMIVEKVEKPYNEELIEIMGIMTKGIKNIYDKDNIENVERKILDYIRKAKFNKELFRNLLLFLRNLSNIEDSTYETLGIHCKIEDIPLLVQYRDKCGLKGMFFNAEVCFDIGEHQSEEDLNTMAERLLELGIDSNYEPDILSITNAEHILSELPEDYGNVNVLSYLISGIMAHYRDGKYVKFHDMVCSTRR